ncbi:cystinosin homolog isoform X2 [Planococcus citri]|uniref:cystinosin homolog isoform X2 n=1 Tax=Planococcus citri TaxID=170843 RepID=UPI0031F876EC
MYESLSLRVILASAILSCALCAIHFEPGVIEPLITECSTVELVADSPLKHNSTIDLEAEFVKVAEVKPQKIIVTSESRWHVHVCAQEPGFTSILAKIDNSTLLDDEAVLHVFVGKITYLKLVALIVGWIYFSAWSISFYPQIYDNYRRQSVVGLNFDFCALNIAGYLLYSFYNIGMKYIPSIQKEYFSRHPTGLNPVEFNDVFFSTHAFFASLVVIYQCYSYESSSQCVSKIAKLILVLYVCIVAASGTAAFFNVLHWLDFLYYCSYIKLSVTIIKYIPQAVMNYTRKSTVGWCIGNVILDFTGGTFSIAQMLINGYNYNDWESIFGDPTKFGLGIFSVAFDTLFLYQHYVLYRKNNHLSNHTPCT